MIARYIGVDLFYLRGDLIDHAADVGDFCIYPSALTSSLWLTDTPAHMDQSPGSIRLKTEWWNTCGFRLVRLTAVMKGGLVRLLNAAADR